MMVIIKLCLAKNIAVWIRIQRHPIELYNEVFLKRIGLSLGKFLMVDRLTRSTQGENLPNYMLNWIWKSLWKPISMSEVIIKLLLEYEGLHSICFRCGRVGHKKDQCNVCNWGCVVGNLG